MGASLLVVDAIDSTGAPARAQAGLYDLTWSDLGIRARNDVLVIPGEQREITLPATDTSEAQVVTAPVLVTAFNTQRVNPDHPITTGLMTYLSAAEGAPRDNLNSLFFNSAHSIELNGALASSIVAPLIFTDAPGEYGESAFADYIASGYSEYNIGSDTPPGDLIVAAAFEDPILRSRMIVLGDGDFLQNGAGFQTSPSYTGSYVYPNNVRFMVNAVAWLLERGMVDIPLPTPGSDRHPNHHTVTDADTASDRHGRTRWSLTYSAKGKVRCHEERPHPLRGEPLDLHGRHYHQWARDPGGAYRQVSWLPRRRTAQYAVAHRHGAVRAFAPWRSVHALRSLRKNGSG